MTASRSADLARYFSGIDEVITFDRKGKDRGVMGRIRLMARLLKRRFDFAVVLKDSVTHKFLGIWHFWSLRDYLNCRPSDRRVHVVDSYLDFLRHHAVSVEKAEFLFEATTEEQQFADQFLKTHGVQPSDRLVGILPISAWSLKNWPVEKFNQLAARLREESGVKTIVFGKSGEDQLGEWVTARLSPDLISAVDKTNLRQAMALIRRCSLFIGPDSSLIHLASCMGVVSLGLYGPTPTDYNYPYFHRDQILVTDHPPDCLPCYPSMRYVPCKNKFLYGACMEDIAFETVLRKVNELLLTKA